MKTRSRESVSDFLTPCREVDRLPDKTEAAPDNVPDNIRNLAGTKSRIEMIQMLHAATGLSRSAQRLRSLTISLLEDETTRVHCTQEHIVVDKEHLKLRSIVQRCSISSEGTASKWRQDWIKNRYVETNTIHMAAFTNTPTKVTPPPDIVDSQTQPTSNLALLLAELRIAHQHGLSHLIETIEQWIEIELSTTRETSESTAKEKRETAKKVRGTATPSRELVSSFIDKSKLTNSTSPAETSRCRGNRQDQSFRTEHELLALLEPLTTLIHQRHLDEMNNWQAVEGQLRNYSNDQITEAVRRIARLVRADESIKSPIGLLFHHAREGTPDFFEITTTETLDTDNEPAEPNLPVALPNARKNIAAIKAML